MSKLDKKSIAFRRVIVDILEASRRGHIGSAFSIVEILRVLFEGILRLKPAEPNWSDRDRFILSKGHGCLALYVALAEKGFFPREELFKFCEAGALLGGHPEHGRIPGVEASTGALGHGLPIAVGMALAARIDKRQNRVFVLLGDGECNEGSVWEAALSAGKHRLSNLVILVDYNEMQSYGTTHEVQELEPFADKWRSFGAAVVEVDGHDMKGLQDVLSRVPFAPDKPSVVICHTVKGRGVSFIEHNAQWHHKAKVSPEELSLLKHELDGQP